LVSCAPVVHRRNRRVANPPQDSILPHKAASRKRNIAAESRGGAEEECPHEWGHGSLKGYATVLRRGEDKTGEFEEV
jgi:hypothetical protein